MWSLEVIVAKISGFLGFPINRWLLPFCGRIFERDYFRPWRICCGRNGNFAASALLANSFYLFNIMAPRVARVLRLVVAGWLLIIS